MHYFTVQELPKRPKRVDLLDLMSNFRPDCENHIAFDIDYGSTQVYDTSVSVKLCYSPYGYVSCYVCSECKSENDGHVF